ncbi:MAG: aminotransferase class I/II-fold pyridoxal phosphate-dependent enzyme [Synergistaceae bacterium]|jgi:histidinol-phosphate aminotransferase|nr:aminotransferase class I/II-fold pyridoxal phosphate-dependent enzyme [Synergistaceae bacterium]
MGDVFGAAREVMNLSQMYKYPENIDALAEIVTARWPSLRGVKLLWGAGSMGVLANLARVFCGGSVNVLGMTPQFLPGLMEFALAGAKIVTLSPRPDRFRVDAKDLSAALEEDTTLLYLDNPNNPTGAVMPLDEVAALAEACARQGALLLVDEAYADYLDDAESAFNLEMSNVICLRTLSKGYGMAGLRVGYAAVRDPELYRVCEDCGLLYAISGVSAALAAKFLPRVDFSAIREKVRYLKSRVTEFISDYDAFTIADTHPAIPIFLLTWKQGGNLYEKLMEAGIRAEAGHFFELNDCSVRLRVPSEELLEDFFRLWRGLFGER